jgi:hypothetical protein
MNIQVKLIHPEKLEVPDFATYVVKEVMRGMWFIVLLDPNIDFIGPFETRIKANNWLTH